jgi:hypothetical protein
MGHTMRLSGFILSVKIWLAACLVATMLIGPASADVHAMDPDTIACQALDDQLAAFGTDRTDDGQSRPDHDHHAHTCGSCHFHLVGSFPARFVSPWGHRTVVLPEANVLAPRAGPFGLYRPPRV